MTRSTAHSTSKRAPRTSRATSVSPASQEITESAGHGTEAGRSAAKRKSQPHGGAAKARAKAVRTARKPAKPGRASSHRAVGAASHPTGGAAAGLLVPDALSEHLTGFGQLPSASQATLQATLRHVAEVLMATGSSATVAELAGSLQARAQTVRDVIDLVQLGDIPRLQSVLDVLDPEEGRDPDATDLQEAEARGRLRLRALYQKIIADSYSLQELRGHWGVSRQRLAQLRSEDRLFAISVPFHRALLYPHWQFGADLRPRPIMPSLIQEAKRSGLDAIGFHELMTNPDSGAGISPAGLLDRGEERAVLDIIRATDA